MSGAGTHDAQHWDDRYAGQTGPRPTEPRPAAHLLDPDPTVVGLLAPLPPGRALDLATGLGRHARWLAARGWAVTAVDFSAVGIARARALPVEADPATLAVPVTWVVADVRTWTPEPGAPAYDLVLCAYVHLDRPTFARVRQWLAPGGQLVVVARAAGTYGYDEGQLRAAATGLSIERLEVTADRAVLSARAAPAPG